MDMVISGAVTIKLLGLLKTKHLPGEWAAIYDGTHNNPPQIALYLEPSSKSAIYILVLEHLKFPDKTYLQPEASFNLSVKKDKYQFQFESINDRDDWINSLCYVSHDLSTQRASSVHVSDWRNSASSAELMQDNFLYDSCGSVQQFKVSVCPTKASAANKLQGCYILNPTVDCLRLMEIGTSRGLHDWPYKQIRKYGNYRKVFKMEVGRKCSTGEGEFEFFTPDCATVVNCISMYMKQVQENKGKPSEEKIASFKEVEPAGAYPVPGHEIQGFDSRPDVPVPAPRSKVNSSPTTSEAYAQGFTDYSDVDASQFGTNFQSQPVDKKMSERERKSQEKAAAKLKKQEKEREAKERKEREKKLKEQKGKSRTGSASGNPQNNIYDEPENIAQTGSPPAVHDSESASAVYSTPQKQKDGWKKHGRPEDFQVHTEDYSNIKATCLSQPKLGTPSAHNFTSGFIADTGDDTYNRLGDFTRQAAAGQENIYGMASAKDTLSPTLPPPPSSFASGNGYEEAADAGTRKNVAREVKNEYEDTANPFVGNRPPRHHVMPSDGDYSDVS